MKKLNDYTVQLGGPLKKDKAFWWFSAQRYAIEQDPIGPRLKSDGSQPALQREADVPADAERHRSCSAASTTTTT